MTQEQATAETRYQLARSIYIGLYRNRVITNIQFTPLREGRLDYVVSTLHPIVFQFTPLREGRRALPELENLIPAYFNSRPCKRGDMVNPKDKFDLFISIHAPA